MIVLGLETSSGLCSVGLADEHGALACRSLTATTVHSEQLPSLIQTVLSEAIISLQDLGAVAVSSGPGSFTGLRIGMSAAKGLCFSLKRPLLVVPTFSGLAVSGATKHKAAGKILVALDAKKGDFYWGIFKMREGAVRAEGSVLLREPGDLKKGIGSQEGLVVVTDSPMVAQSFRGAVMAIEEAREHYRGDLIAVLGVQQVGRGEMADVAAAEPMYLKDFVPKRVPSRV